MSINNGKAPRLELTREEIVYRLDCEARERLGISARDMIDRYRAGSLEDPSAVRDLLILASLLPDGDPLLVSFAA
jgi:hypothetical protein